MNKCISERLDILIREAGKISKKEKRAREEGNEKRALYYHRIFEHKIKEIEHYSNLINEKYDREVINNESVLKKILKMVPLVEHIFT